MKKFIAFIKRVFSGPVAEIGIGIGIDQLGDLGLEALEKFHEKHPVACKAMVSSMYVWIDTIVEDMADKSPGKLDDKAVDEAKKELEAFATKYGFELTNLDAD